MSQHNPENLSRLLSEHEAEILSDWVAEQASPEAVRGGVVKEAEVRGQCAGFLRLTRDALAAGGGDDIRAKVWDEVRRMLEEVSRSRGLRGASPSQTALFVFSLKRPLFSQIRREFGRDGEALANETWKATQLLDRLGLFTTEVHQRAREDVIRRQQQEMLELSTPVVKVFDGILAVPLIGTLDSARTQVVMESLLQAIVDTGSAVAIVDITGVPTVDTLTAQHLLKTVTAARLMGAECIISGIRPQIAQTIVHLGIDLGNIATKATMADALSVAFQKIGVTVRRGDGPF